VAPGTTAPLASVTVPVRVAKNDWAKDGTTSKSAAQPMIRQQASTFRGFIGLPPIEAVRRRATSPVGKSIFEKLIQKHYWNCWTDLYPVLMKSVKQKNDIVCNF
jgi:hypothetical protein